MIRQITQKQLYLLLLICLIIVGLAARFILLRYSLHNLSPSTDEAISQLLANAISRGDEYPLLFYGQPYQFPLEAYMMSVFSDSLPNDAFGARIQPFIIRLITTVMLCIAAFKVLGKYDRLPTLALILVPSAYWLNYQAGYFVPQHTVFAFFSSLIFLLAIHLNRLPAPAYLLTAVTGLLSGLLISNHLLALSVVVGAFCIVVFSGSRPLFLRRTAVFGGGLLLGMIPYFLAVLTIEGAYDAIINRLDIGVFIHRFFNVVISHTLPGAMGINPPYFQDFADHIEWDTPLRSIFVGVFLIMMLIIITERLYRFYQHTIQSGWPRLEWPDMFLIITLASITLMSVNSSSQWDEHRYILPAVWSFPFLLGYLYSWRHTLMRYAIMAVTIGLVIINIAAGNALIDVWRDAKQIRNSADIPELSPIMNWMQSQDFKHCYATFWQAYRVTYESDGKITCGPVYNERFLDWPVPFKDEVNRQNRVVYLLSHTHGTRYSFIKFEKRLKAYGISYQRKQFGKYFVFYDFEYSPAKGEKLLPVNAFSLHSNIAQADAAVLSDGNYSKSWGPLETQSSGQYVEARFTQSQNVRRVDLVYPFVKPDPARSVRILGKQDNAWIDLTGEVKFEPDLFAYYNHHPVLGEYLQTIRFDSQLLDGIRIELVSPEPGKQWTLSEIRLGVQTDQ